MRVFQIYNRYRSGGGGETTVVKDTVRLLEENGHNVLLLEPDSTSIRTTGAKIRAAIGGIYSLSARQSVSRYIREWRPNIVHVHNLYPLLSPSVLGACRSAGVPVVMTVHNFGLTCPVQTHLRDGAPCTRCVDSGDHNCIIHNCRGNIAESAVYSLRHAFARRLRLFENSVSLFLPVSEFIRDVLVSAGFLASHMFVLPNGVAIPEVPGIPEHGHFVAYVGRFSTEKGLMTLLAAAKMVPNIEVRLYGSGPMSEQLRAAAPPNVSINGWVPREDLKAVYRQARCIVLPSAWNEPFGIVAIEAMSYGLPVIASRVGGLSSIITDGDTGFLVTPDDPAELAMRIRVLARDGKLAGQLGRRAREVSIQSYSEAAYYRRLIEAYRIAERSPVPATQCGLLNIAS